jgi:Xaa-Pro dipeptidase/ectoine hydrolase
VAIIQALHQCFQLVKAPPPAHLTWSNELFKENEATVIEISGAYKRYHCPMARTVFLGKEDQQKLDVMNKTIEALRRGQVSN